jgi:hypothetical protein
MNVMALHWFQEQILRKEEYYFYFKSPTFLDIMPCSSLKVSRRFGGTALLATRFMLVSYLAYFSTLKMKMKCSCEMSVEFQQNTCHYVPKR